MEFFFENERTLVRFLFVQVLTHFFWVFLTKLWNNESLLFADDGKRNEFYFYLRFFFCFPPEYDAIRKFLGFLFCFWH